MQGVDDSNSPLLGQEDSPVCWGCTINGTIDIKKWFLGIITPDFQSEEARLRCGSIGNEVAGTVREVKRLEEAMRTMRANTKELNSAAAVDKPEKMISRVFSPLNPGGIRSCTAALTATALGSGALGLPYAFSLTGLGLGLVTLTAAAFIAALSLQILMVAARYTGTSSYAGVLELAGGSRLASAALDIVITLNGVGAVACILIFEGDFIPAVLAAPPGFAGWEVGRSAAVLGAALASWPLVLPAEISALRYTAVVVPLALFVTLAIVSADVPEFAMASHAKGGRVKWWDFKLSRWLEAAAIMVNAFANHTNAVPAALQLESPSIARIVKATVYANTIVLVMLGWLGIAGYVSWAGVTKGDFVLNYPDDRIEIWVCRLMLALLVYLVLPVTMFPTAKSTAQLAMAAVGRDSRQGVGPVTHAVTATTLLALCTAIAVSVRDVASVLGVLGGILASSIMFWFPALVFRRLLWPTQPRYFRWPVLLSIVGLGATCWASVAAKFLVTAEQA